MAELTVQQTTLSGIDPSFTAASAGGDAFDNDGRTVLRVVNGHTAAQTVTVDAVYPCNQGHDHDAVVSVPAGGDREIGPFPVGQFGSAPAVTYSGVTALTVAAVRIA